MGRLFDALVAHSGDLRPSESCESANQSGEPVKKIADSQVSQAVLTDPAPEIRGIAEVAALSLPDSRLMHLCLAMGISWKAVAMQLLQGDSEAAIDQLDHDKGDGRELAAVVFWLRVVEQRASKA